jgi:hypothetical protein
METESLREAQRYVNGIELCCPPGRYNEWADGDDSAENQKVMLCVHTVYACFGGCVRLVSWTPGSCRICTCWYVANSTATLLLAGTGPCCGMIPAKYASATSLHQARAA